MNDQRNIDDAPQGGGLLEAWITRAVAPVDLDSFMDAQIQALLDSCSAAAFSDEQIELILRKVDARIAADQQADQQAGQGAGEGPGQGPALHTGSPLPLCDVAPFDAAVPPSGGAPPAGQAPAAPPASPPASQIQYPKGDARSSPVLGFLGGLAGLSGLPTLLLASFLWIVVSALSIIALASVIGLMLSLAGLRGPELAGGHGDTETRRHGDTGAQGSPCLPFSPSPLLPFSPSIPSSVAHLARVHDCQWMDPDAAPRLGQVLAAGQRLELRSGQVEIAFNRGTRMVVEGPALFQVTSDNTSYLRYGRLRAAVPRQAIGFAVDTNWGRVVDLGTEFGVVAGYDEDWGEVHVFTGTVCVEPPLAAREESSPQKSLVPPLQDLRPKTKDQRPSPKSRIVLGQGQAITVSAHGEVQPIKAQPERVAAVMPAEEFPLWSSGAGLARGAADPHWQIVAVSTDQKFKPCQAVVVTPAVGYARDARDVAQWLALPQGLADMPAGCRWTFRTKFDLTGFDAGTARIKGWFSVDDYIAELRVNGKQLPAPLGARAKHAYAKKAPLRIDGGFVAGENTIELVIENSSDDRVPNPMALYIEWKGTAQRAEQQPLVGKEEADREKPKVEKPAAAKP